MPHLQQTARRGAALPGAPDLLSRAVATLWRWQFRWRSRRALARLDAHLLRDIGLAPYDRAQEAAKPFWRA